MQQAPEDSGTRPAGPKERRFKIDIFEAWCKACGICVAFCPQGCLARDEEGVATIVAAERCTGCGWCEIHCPDFAIAVREETDAAAGPGREDEED